MKDKICIITGASSGIGKEMAMQLASRGASLILVGRDQKKGETALNEIKEKSGNKNIEMLYADFSIQSSIQALASEIKSRTKTIDILINNAGAFYPSRQLSPDGIEMTFAVNHMGYYILTQHLMDRLLEESPGRIINTSSKAHYSASLDPDDINFENKMYNGWKAYANSKLCNLYFTYHLAEQYRDRGLRVNAFHPGVIATDIVRKMFFPVPQLWKLFSKSVKEGAAGGVFLASSPDAEGMSGKFFDGVKEKKSSAASLDRSVQDKIMELSGRLYRPLS